jgi:AraC family transcriptional regulator
MLTNCLAENGASGVTYAESAPSLPKTDALVTHRPPPLCEPKHAHSQRRLQGCDIADVVHPVVEISPADAVRRRAMTWNGVAAESVQLSANQSVKYSFHAPVHLLVAYESGERSDGETFVEGMPRSTLRTFARKFTFVPAGHRFQERHDPGVHLRIMFFYFDPATVQSDPAAPAVPFVPQVHFDEATMWPTVLKIMNLVESPVLAEPRYFEALGIVLLHEFARRNNGKPSAPLPSRGGLAMWQQRIVTDYIEEHLTERIPLAALARLVRLSPHHFCRAFKESLGAPPRRYQTKRRMEHAKRLLENPTVSVTEIGLMMGFCDTSSFTTAFRKHTGFTPTAYHRMVS